MSRFFLQVSMDGINPFFVASHSASHNATRPFNSSTSCNNSERSFFKFVFWVCAIETSSSNLDVHSFFFVLHLSAATRFLSRNATRLVAFSCSLIGLRFLYFLRGFRMFAGEAETTEGALNSSGVADVGGVRGSWYDCSLSYISV